MAAGRPRLPVNRENLQLLMSMRFNWDDISTILGPSTRTLQRRAKEWDIPTYTDFTASEIDDLITLILNELPNAGEVLIMGCLFSQWYRIQREKVRQSIHRLRGTEPHHHIYRRTYSVPGPNYLWHIDGNHKLIRYRLVIHGGIDGFSRLTTFLHCASNNTAETVLSHFMTAVEEYGMPSRVRSNYGGENIGVWRFMEAARGEERCSFIAGSSVHNTRIERLGRDLYGNVTSTYLIVFSEL